MARYPNMSDPALNTTTKVHDWAALVREVEGEAFKDRPVAYEFNQGRRVFKNLEENAGVYVAEPPP